jgi:hypothetical protein
MKPITMYECPYCKKLFKTPDKHRCRRNPELKNCYSCKHWKHQFVIDTREEYSCEATEACSVESDCAFDAFYVMKNKGWLLNCPQYEGIGQAL